MYISGFMLDAGRPQRLKDRKMRRIRANLPFPLFKLPREIRNIIYEKVFSTSLNDKVITPDPSYSRRRYDDFCRKHGATYLGVDRAINNGLALLQSCQQAHEEAAAVLYGQSTFYFDDSQQYETFSRKTFAVDVSAHCYYCRQDRCWSACSGGKHLVDIPFTDLVTLKSWLSTIGERNRLRIRHIQIHFSDSRFTKVQPASHWTWDRRPGKPSHVGGDVLAEALQFLAGGHNLDTFGIFFISSPRDLLDDVGFQRRLHRMAFGHLFSETYHPHSGKMMKALSSICGIRMLECEDITDADEQDKSEMTAIQGDYRKVKAAMEYGYGKHLKLEAPALWSKPYVDQIEWVMQDPKPKVKKRR
ncbi:MAG: hypothetical protein ASARMPREDX12_007670 [Alectoria sarmentosa]|nr:MAG: hypothetical protein ASARMPREDX12_007670 [Alectoria sarmentosa]